MRAARRAIAVSLAGAIAASGCRTSPRRESSFERVAGKGAPPQFALALPAEITRTIPRAERVHVQDAIRMEKRTRLYRTRALLPALEIVRKREAAFRAAARGAGLDRRLFEGLIVLESGGADDAVDYMFVEGRGKRAHVGLGQIGWSEGQAAGLKVAPRFEVRLRQEIRDDLELCRRLCAGPGDPNHASAALLNGLRRTAATLIEWRRVDERFDPDKNLGAAARLLRGRLGEYAGEPTLAIASYHAGAGNIGRALRLARESGQLAGQPSYWKLYALQDGPAFDLMRSWSDDSRNYLPKVAAAADIVEKYLVRPREFRDEYLYWGPDDAAIRLAAVTSAGSKTQSGGSAG